MRLPALARYPRPRKTAPVSFRKISFMKKIFILFPIILVVLLFIGSKVFGAVTYERTPAGYNITSPVSFDIAIDNFETRCLDTYPETAYWGVLVWAMPDDLPYISDTISSTTLSGILTISIPVGSLVYDVEGICSVDNIVDEGDGYFLGGPLENNEEWTTIFEIISGETFTFIPISTNFVTSSLGYVGQAVSGLGPFLYFIIGIPVSFWVLSKVLSLAGYK